MWVEKKGNGLNDFTRVARYPDGTEWDLPVTLDENEPNENDGWYFSKTIQKEEDKEVICRIISTDQSQMQKIHCHGCEFSWPHINKSRTFCQNKFIMKKMPDFEVFMDVTYKPTN